MNDVLVVKNARKRFAATVALNGADLSLRRGEWLGLLGPNGAGKTTLIRALSGRVHLDSGELTLFGEPVRDAKTGKRLRQRLGIVPQEIALYVEMTPRENLASFGRLNGLSGAALRERVEWALSWTGLAERGNEPLKGFSGGMKRRLNIACGVLHKPDIVLLDEPTVGVDPQSRERIWAMLEELRGAGASLLLTTHQLDEAQKIVDRIVIIDHGRVIADGSFPELISRTIGQRRRVTLTLSGKPNASLGPEVELVGAEARTPMTDVAAELPVLLTRVGQTGVTVEDIHVDAPSLHAVFIHLTGRELRE